MTDAQAAENVEVEESIEEEEAIGIKNDAPSLEDLANSKRKVKKELKNLNVPLTNERTATEDINKAYQDIGLSQMKEGLFKEAVKLVDRLRGRNAKQYLKEYAAEAERMYQKYDRMTSESSARIYDQETEKNKAGTEYCKIQRSIQSLDQLIQGYDSKISELNGKLKKFMDMTLQDMQPLFGEYAQHIEKAKCSDEEEQMSSLMYAMLDTKTKLEKEKMDHESYKEKLSSRGTVNASKLKVLNNIVKNSKAHLRKFKIETLPAITYVLSEMQALRYNIEPETLYKSAEAMIGRIKVIQRDADAYFSKTAEEIEELERKYAGIENVEQRPFTKPDNELHEDTERKYKRMTEKNEQEFSQVKEILFG